MGFGTQDLLQRRDSAGIPWLGDQTTDGFLSHLPVGIALRHLDEESNEIS
jgi:hypothetical protein